MFARPKKAKKCKFTPEEDEKLKELVSLHGENDWSFIAKQMENRNARQCRERWRNYMNPKLCNDNWTPLEDQQLLERYNQIGPHWNVIGRAFPNRSINCVRNRVIKLLRMSGRTTTNLQGQPPFVYSYQQAMGMQQMLPNMFYFFGSKEESPPPVQVPQPTPAPVPIPQTPPQPMEPQTTDEGSPTSDKTKGVERIYGLMPSKEIADIFANPMEELGIEEGVIHF